VSGTSPGSGAKGFGLPDRTVCKVTVLSSKTPNDELEKMDGLREIDLSSFNVVSKESDDATDELESIGAGDDELEPKYQ